MNIFKKMDIEKELRKSFDDYSVFTDRWGQAVSSFELNELYKIESKRIINDFYSSSLRDSYKDEESSEVIANFLNTNLPKEFKKNITRCDIQIDKNFNFEKDFDLKITSNFVFDTYKETDERYKKLFSSETNQNDKDDKIKNFSITFLSDIVKNPDKYEIELPNIRDEIKKISKLFENICSQMKLDFNKEDEFNRALNSLYEVYIEKKGYYLSGFETEEKCRDFFVENFDNEVLNGDTGYANFVNNYLQNETENIFSKVNNFSEFVKNNPKFSQDEMSNEFFRELKDSVNEKEKTDEFLLANDVYDETELAKRVDKFDFSNGSDLVVSPKDMFAWINDEESIVFPFDEKDTINNKDFAYAFAQECMNPKTKLSDLREALNKLKAKNMQLEKMLDEAKNGKLDLMKEMKDELEKSDKINRDFKEFYQGEFDVNLDENIYKKVRSEEFQKYKKTIENDEKVYKNNKWSKK